LLSSIIAGTEINHGNGGLTLRWADRRLSQGVVRGEP
jgi:hypothetical protein